VLKGEAPLAASIAAAPAVATAQPPVDDSMTRMLPSSAPPPTVPPSEGYRELEEPPPSNNLAFVFGAFALLATLALLVFLVIRLLNPSDTVAQVTVPDVTNMTLEEARDELRQVGLFAVPQNEASDTVETGRVIRTDPPANEMVDDATSVTVFVSVGTATNPIPSLLGMTLEAATAEIESNGFVLGTVTTEPDSEVEPGTVIAQSPAEGEQAEEGATIDLVTSSGPDALPIPNVDNLTEADATRILSDAGFEVETTSEYSEEVDEDRVIRTVPAANEEAEPGSVVQIVLSDGPEPVEVPQLFGLTPDEARPILDNLGLELVVVDATVETDDVALVGKIVTQDPEDGQNLLRGDQVQVALGELREIDVPDLTGLDEGAARRMLEGLGLVLDVEAVPVEVDDPAFDGRIVVQDPEDGTVLNPGDVVTVRLGDYVEPPTETTATTTQ
jgi:beta-lactam-binding protein with PASTA domain